MMTSIGEVDEELNERSVADHLRGSDARNFGDPGYLQFAGFDKSDASWAGLLSRHKSSMDEASPQHSHLSPDQSSISELASFEYNQRLPSLESSSSAPIGRSASGLASQPLFAWQPFGTPASVHPHSQASSLHGPGGHLFPLASGSVGAYGTEFPTHSPSSSATINIPCGPLDVSRDKSDSQFNPLAYANVSAALSAASGRLRVTAASPSGHELQPIRMDVIGLSSVANASTTAVTPIPAYAASVGSSNSQSSTPAHQAFTFTPNGGGSQLPQQQLSTTASSSNISSTPQPYDEHSKTVTFKQRSKKESHNRIERKRRDYINSQIVYLSSLLPPELYRDVDGRRNKGSVLRLSVNYIKDLREAVSRMSGLKQENSLARQLIPLLLKRIETLERILNDSSNTTAASPSTMPIRHSASFETLYQSWLHVNESNKRAAAGANNGNPCNPTPNSRVPGTMFPVGEMNYFHDLMQTDTDASEIELTSTSMPNTSASVSSGNVVQQSNNITSLSKAARLVNVKREQTDEERLNESMIPSRLRLDACRLPSNCDNVRVTFAELSNPPSRMDEEVTPLHSITFEPQPNLSYERYHRLMQPTCQPGGVFGQNE